MPQTIAAPSWVMAGSIYENCVFLEQKVDEVGLLFFETDACLAYTKDDLPPALASLDLSYHVHMPLDLPWQAPEHVVEIVLALMEKVQFLNVTKAVIHPPITQGAAGIQPHAAQSAVRHLLQAWQDAGYAPNTLLLENIEGVDLTEYIPLLTKFACGLCIDTGHMIAYGQDDLLVHPAIWDFLQMVHLNAPADMTTRKGRSKHASLTALDERGRTLVRNVLTRCKPDTVLMYELFSWEHILSSRTVVDALFLPENDQNTEPR